MNDLEERLRAVTRAAAGQIAPASIAPLRVPVRGRRHRIVTGLTGWMSFLRVTGPRTRPWLAPLTAAVAVAALVAGSVTAAHAIGAHRATHPGRAAASAAVKLPPYYAMLPLAPSQEGPVPGPVYIRATMTGKLIKTVPPPKGLKFTAVSGAADDATFVLSAETPAQVREHEKHAGRPGLAGLVAPARLYLLRFDPTTGTAKVTPLTIPALPSVTWFALSADGGSLAVSTATSHAIGLTVYSVATGASRNWTQSTSQGGEHRWLAAFGEPWTEGTKVEVSVIGAKGHPGLTGLLDTTGKGGSLVAAIHPLPAGPCAFDVLDPDGNLGFGAVTTKGSIPWRLQECAYRHGQAKVVVPGRTIHYKTQTVDLSGEFWVSPDGGTVLIDGVAGPPQRPMTAVAGLLAGDQIKAIPGSGLIPQIDTWPGTAAAW